MTRGAATLLLSIPCKRGERVLCVAEVEEGVKCFLMEGGFQLTVESLQQEGGQVILTEPEGEEDEEVGGILVLLPPKVHTWILLKTTPARVGAKTSKVEGDMALGPLHFSSR